MKKNHDFKVGDLIIYQNGDRFEIGKIKRMVDDGAFVWYSTGETEAITEEVQIHGAMVYGCKDCMSRWIMYLEKGLEEPGCDDRKPVPFGIRCPFCGGFRTYDISGYIRIPGNGYQALPKNASYFANLPDRDCGVSRISGMMDSLDEHEIPSARIVRETR